MRIEKFFAGLALALAAAAGAAPAIAADHGDTPNLIALARHDARISDLHVFRDGDNLVLALSTFPNLAALSYRFPSDLTLRLHIDNHSAVSFDNPVDNAQFGGTIVDPEGVGADITLTFTFDRNGTLELATSGLSGRQEKNIKLFAGMRDDPFIRGPQIGRNVAAIVVEFPLADALGEKPQKKKRKPKAKPENKTLLVWATSDVPDIAGPYSELGARALRSQCPQPVCVGVDGADLNLRNETSPHQYALLLNLRPDVVIYDASRPAAFPNGRALTDDVVNLIAPFGQNILANDYPCPSANDVPFLADFPYLAPPQYGVAPPGPGPACPL
ncbi:MAG TPA: hypothetical protein PKM48_00470 [Parvularculaceae bacterium]|nr:hypothetical protein [Parvularculaceae bacterium]HNS85258.1 hypothetical protein [Parvularculaceae bacterium]